MNENQDTPESQNSDLQNSDLQNSELKKAGAEKSEAAKSRRGFLGGAFAVLGAAGIAGTAKAGATGAEAGEGAASLQLAADGTAKWPWWGKIGGVKIDATSRADATVLVYNATTDRFEYRPYAGATAAPNGNGDDTRVDALEGEILDARGAGNNTLKAHFDAVETSLTGKAAGQLHLQLYRLV